MPVYIYCPKCESRFDVTGCEDGTRLECDECGREVEVRYENLVLMPGGIAAEVKESGGRERTLVCPKCGLNIDLSRLTPGNRFRCRRCRLLLEVPGAQPARPRPVLRRGDDILKCHGCRTRYDISHYSPGNRFRCRRCGLTLTVPQRGSFQSAGQWEIDVEKSLIRCNRCGRSYPLDSASSSGAFVCKKCRRVFTEPMKPTAPTSELPDEEWEIDLDSGLITCSGCRYSYDLTGLTPGDDFFCRHCGRVFRMPVEVPRAETKEHRERIACPRCGTPYDVSGYLAGTLFSCERCDHVLAVDGAAAPAPMQAAPAPTAIPEPPAVRVTRERDTGRIERQSDSPVSSAPPPEPARAAAPEEEPRSKSPAPEMPEPDYSFEGLMKEATERLERREREASGAAAPPESVETGGMSDEAVAEEDAPSPVEEPPPPPEDEPPPPTKVEEPPPPPEEEEPTPPPPAEKEDLPPPPPPKKRQTRSIAPPKDTPNIARKTKKTSVRLVVRCTVCGTRHDAGGKVPGDRIDCVCGKKIRITAPKKKGSGKMRESQILRKAEDLLEGRSFKSGDVDVIEPD